MKHQFSHAFFILLGGVVALFLWQHATFGAVATSSTLGEPFGAKNGAFMGAENVEFVGQIGGPSYAVAVQGNYAYVGMGPRLLILDISDPANFTIVGQSDVLPDIVNYVVVVGDYAYVANDDKGGLRIIDIADPSAPQEVGAYDTPGDAKAVTIAGNYAYVADGYNGGLRIINIKNPKAPQEVGSYDTPGDALHVSVAGSYAYIADSHEGLRIINIATPSAPQEVASYDTPGTARGVTIAHSYAYVADYYNGLRIIDITNPSAPQEVGSYDTPGHAWYVSIAGNYAYLAHHYGGLRIIDIKNPSAPQEVGFYHTPGYAFHVSIAGSYAYVADDLGLRIINIKNPSAPQEVGSYDTPGYAFHVSIADNYAYVGGYNRGLQIIDIANPSAPQLVSFYDTHLLARGVTIAGSTAYVASYHSGLRIIDITNPSAPQEVGFYDTPGEAWRVSIADSYAYVADGSSGLRIIDITNPSAPQEVGFYDTPGSAEAVTIVGTTAYVADGPSGLRIIDIANPKAPQEVGFYDTPGDAYHVTIAGGVAYVATSSGLRIINIATPAAPQEVGFYDTGRALAVTIVGNRALLADFNAGLLIIDIANPSAPQEVGSYDTPGETSHVTIAGTHVYVADNHGGLIILRLTGDGTPTATPTATRTYTPTPIGTVTATRTSSPTPISTVTATRTSSPTPIGTVTATRTSSPTPISTATNTPTPSTDGGDNYESDDVCEQAGSITTNGIMQPRTFHQPGDTDWVSVEVMAGREYLIEALTPADSAADVVLSVYDGCESVPSEGQDPSFSPDIRLQFVAPSSGTYYLQLSNDNLEAAGASVAYDLSVRALADEATTGALILVGGRYRSNDPLQDNIHHVTNSVYELFLAHGYTDDNIYYLASEEIDINNDGINDVDASPTNRNLELAITEWARDKVGPERALTIYMISHGTIDRLYLNGISQTLKPTELDSWLDELENGTAGVNVNLIVEACHAGSFIELEESVSQEGRVVIASTGTHPLAYASENGAYFSDAFIGALGRGKSLYGAFSEARTIAQISHPDQSAWLDDNGDQLPNRNNDGLEAQQRGFAFANGLPAIQWAPYISDAEIGDITNENGIISARVEDDQGVLSVWADIYKPSYAPPDNSAEEMPKETLPSIRLRDENGDGIYSGLYENFAEEGEYRIVIYASDVESLQGEPVSLTVQVGSGNQLYLPLLLTR